MVVALVDRNFYCQNCMHIPTVTTCLYHFFRDAEFAYLFGPVGLLLLINGLLFCLTAQELLCGLWRLDNSDSITFRRKSMGLVVAKLGIVMGMGWILDVLSWGFGKKIPFFFYVGDVFNALQVKYQHKQLFIDIRIPFSFYIHV